MIRRGKGLFTGLLLVVLAGLGVVLIGFPYLEKRWTFLAPERPDKPWPLPDGAEAVSFGTSDGARLAGWFLEGMAPRTGITILLLHGSLGMLTRYVPNAEFMRQRGFNVLLFNYRGFGMSDDSPLDKRTLERDALAAQRYLTKDRGIDPRSIAFAGMSIGGPIAARLAARVPCRAVALVGSIASARRQLQHGRPWLPRILLDNLPLDTPLDAIDTIGRANCPVLVIHGANDEVVPLADARDVHDAARPPKRFFVVPEAGHGFRGVDHSAFMDQLASFLVDPKGAPK